MYTIDPTGLISEYLFEAPVGSTVRNTASPGTLDGSIVASATYPLSPSSDVPPGFRGEKSLNYDVLRSLQVAAVPPNASFAQYVQVPAFPDLTELTVEVWVKVDYAKANPFEDPAPGTYPDGAVGFGACPQPVCKAFAWYLFLSTLRTDRNLVFTHIPDAVTQGLPKSAAPGGNDGGGLVTEDVVHGGQWTHLAATFEDIGGGLFRMQTYVNAISSHLETITAAGGTWHLPEETSHPMAAAPGTALRLGQFRSIQGSLDYQFSGNLCGVRVYERALTWAQINADYRHDICDDTPGKAKPEIKELIDGKAGEKRPEKAPEKVPDKLFEKVPDKPPKIEKLEKPEKEKLEKPEIPEPKVLEPKPPKEIFESGKPGAPVFEQGTVELLAERLRRLERDVSKVTHFIDKALRPDMAKGALKNEPDGDDDD